MSATIKDVARKAGVSVATVSRVFNNVALVDEETGKRVEEVAREMKYFPSPVGRSLSMRRTDAIGLLLPDLFGEFFSEVLRGGDQTAQHAHYHLVVSSSHNNREEIEAALKMMRGRVDGLVIMSPHIDAQTLDANLPRTMPIVLLNCYVDGDNFDSLNIDNFGGAKAMVGHLLEHGHKRIAIIKGNEENFDAVERLRGYRAAMDEGGTERSSHFELPGDFSEAAGYDAARKILGLTPRPTAVFASNDSMAIGALSALKNAGTHVPEEMALASFDDIPIASYLTPSLTSVHVDIDNLGVRAVQRLIHAVKNKNVHCKQQEVLPTTLSLRESCGCTVKDPHKFTS